MRNQPLAFKDPDTHTHTHTQTHTHTTNLDQSIHHSASHIKVIPTINLVKHHGRLI